MTGNQFAVYQLRQSPETRKMRFQSYGALQEKGIQIRYENYEQVYLGQMQPADSPDSIKDRFRKQLPRTFKGHAISVSDVLVLNRDGVVTSYYVEKEGFIVLAGFIRNGSSSSLISFETTGFHIEGKRGSWLAIDSIIIDGQEFFLMEHEKYGADGTCVVLDAAGKLIADSVYNGFDQLVQQRIKDYLNPPISVPEPVKQGKQPLEDWQKYMENGEYLRSSEMSEEQNYNMIDGRRNNAAPKKTERTSVLAKLRQRQAGIAAQRGNDVPQIKITQDAESVGDMERGRK
ncbi:YodL domain-containing protein [Lacrimispora xylanisolvens]|uniref:YodL domain-containing protein n=1 Tax=Lacrimispora xylanisolvens TaxID=384636 RepID=UPI002402ABBD